MASEARLFIEAVNRATGQIPVWLPGRNVSLGDIGIFDKLGQWVRMTSLKDEGIPFETDYDDTPSFKLSLGSGQTWSVSITGDGKVGTGLPGVPNVNAELKLGLEGSGSFAFEAYGTLLHVITNLAAVQEEIISRSGAAGGNSWDYSWCVVTEVLEAKRSFVAVASGRGATVSLDLGAEPGGAFLNLAKLNIGAAVTNQNQMAVASISTDPTALSFKFRKLKNSVFSGPVFELDAERFLLEGTPEDIEWED